VVAVDPSILKVNTHLVAVSALTAKKESQFILHMVCIFRLDFTFATDGVHPVDLYLLRMEDDLVGQI